MSTPAVSDHTLNARRALLRLLVESPNQTVTHADVCAELGYGVSRQALSAAAKRLARDMPIDAHNGRVGGYTLLLPVAATEHECRACSLYGRYGACKRLLRMTPPDYWCGRWTP